MNTFGRKFRAGNELKKKKKKTVGPDWPEFCILGEILVNILIEPLIKSFENIN